jgi:predicted TIM-barrel fold metal-dependent hydrolase
VAIVGGGVTEAELRALHRGGVRGVRFNLVGHLGGAPELEVFSAALKRIALLDWHVVLHLDAENVVAHAARVERIRVPFVIVHMGRVKTRLGLGPPPFRRLLALLHANPLAWVRICGAECISPAGAPFHDAVPFAAALIEAAPERVLWGTDWPYPNVSGSMPNDGALVGLFARFTTDEGVRLQVLVDNPTRLYWPG